jgi:hypothetical protein
VKIVLLIVAVVLFAIAAIFAVAGGNLGSLSASDLFLVGMPFFVASFLPV